MKKYIVMRDYGTEGWAVQGEADAIVDAVSIREDTLANGGGKVLICQVITALEAYEDAAREQRQITRDIERATGLAQLK